ncbi:hypothetical protein C0J52_27604 [Blattella germanica]|nr:hypothetical protein C0J52_27604 [Blattella germanica]
MSCPLLATMTMVFEGEEAGFFLVPSTRVSSTIIVYLPDETGRNSETLHAPNKEDAIDTLNIQTVCCYCAPKRIISAHFTLW